MEHRRIIRWSVWLRLVGAFFLLCLFALTEGGVRVAYAQSKSALSGSASSENVFLESAASAKSEATVNLYCRIRAGRKQYISTGSGVFISERGIILTNAHVAQFFLLEQKGKKVTG